jgi:transposase InsO family protein
LPSWLPDFSDAYPPRLRDELLNGEIFYSLKEAQIVIESWRRHYNAVRPHESLGYRPPAPEVFVPALAAWPSARLGSAPTTTLSPASRPELN